MKKFGYLSILIVFLTVSSFAGVEWISKITTTGNKKSMHSEMTSQVYAQDGDVKQVFKNVSKSKRNVYVEEGYWLYKGHEKMMYIVNDKEKTVTPVSLDYLLQMMGVVGQLVQISISDQQVKVEELAKEKVLDFMCNHIRVISDYTMKMQITIIKKTMMINEVKEIWASPDIEHLKEINQAFLNKDFRTGFEDLDKMIKKEMKLMKKIGFPLKIITRNIQKNKKGKVKSDSTTTMEVIKINPKSFPKSFFEVPKDYQEVEVSESPRIF
ncbi:MAG: DUF4412 domain-containing protein [Candidatus Aminicenantes bacterium]|nr:DUF4412 domain-containing protein [Candidatus Aminicenantes bacterium]